jgi:hypothetical protein
MPNDEPMTKNEPPCEDCCRELKWLSITALLIAVITFGLLIVLLVRH